MIVESLYPEVANLYGEQANVRYLKQSCNCTVIETSLNEKPAFLSGGKVDLVYLGTLTEEGRSWLLKGLNPSGMTWLMQLRRGRDSWLREMLSRFLVQE